MSIVVAITGASGRLGQLVTEKVTELQGASKIVLTTRRPAELEHTGHDVRFADFDQPESLEAAFAGVDRLLIISTDSIGNRVEQHSAALSAAKKAGVSEVIYTSMLNPSPGHPTRDLAREHLGSEVAVRESGIDWTILRFGFFAQVLYHTATGAIASGKLTSNAADGRASWVSVSDCAAVAAAVLNDGVNAGRTYDVTGPDAPTYGEIAGLLTELSGKAVELEEIDDDTYRQRLLDRGVSPADADEYTTFGVAIREGYVSETTDVVAAITGRAAQPLRDVLTEMGIGATAGSEAS